MKTPTSAGIDNVSTRLLKLREDELSFAGEHHRQVSHKLKII